MTVRVLGRRDVPVYVLLTLLGFAAIVWFLRDWFSHADWRTTPVLFTILTLILLTKLGINQFRWFLIPVMRHPRPRATPSGWRVGVATTFVPGVEPLEMLERTVAALVALDVPHDTWVLDEDDDERVKALCRRLGARHFSRKRLTRYQADSGPFLSRSKYGNYNAWLVEVGYERYDVIATFDPDHVPVAGFLSAVLGYFEDPRVGYVQAAQAYSNQKASFIARGAAEETYAYYAVTQAASYAMGYPVIVGCHNTHRVKALQEAGGFASHHADDLLLTLLYRVKGWQGVYVPRILGRGLTPEDWTGYLVQQLRWARSVLDLKLRRYPRLAPSLSGRARAFSLLHGLTYVEGGITNFLGLTALIAMLVAGVAPSVVGFDTVARLGVLAGVFVLCEAFRQRYYLEPAERGLHWRAALLGLAKWPHLLKAFYDAATGRGTPYTVTPKKRRDALHHLLIWPQLLVATVLGTAWVAGLLLGHVPHPLVHIAAAIGVASSLGLILSALPEVRRAPRASAPLDGGTTEL